MCRYYMMGQRNWLRVIQIPQSMLYLLKTRSGWNISLIISCPWIILLFVYDFERRWLNHLIVTSLTLYLEARFLCIHIDLSFSLVYFFLERDQRYNILLYLQYQEIGQKLSEIGGRLDYPRLTTELAEEIETLWSDAAIQVFYPLTKMFTCLNSLFLSCFFFFLFFSIVNMWLWEVF